jgi:hypothetical protein
MTVRLELNHVYRNQMMHIEPSDNLMNAFSTKSAQEGQPRKVEGTDAVTAELGKDFASVVRQALEAHQDSSDAVAQAKKDLAAGTLDGPEAVEAAAENMLRFGI